MISALSAPLALNADSALPQLGENSAFNIEQEKTIGQRFYRQLMSNGLIETNPLLDRYINDLGARLLSALDLRLRDYHFFIVKDGSVNAFAVPGGYIGIHIGLINQSKSEEQLASVLAHEISHVRLMHSMKLWKKSGEVNETAALSILAGLLLGGLNSELGAAVIFGSAAGSQQSMINFTRENEYEADRLGIELLQNAGFDASGMVEFFQILDRISGSSEYQNIEYLRTHPINSNRISEAQSRIKNLPRVNRISRNNYTLFQDYLSYINHDLTISGSSQFSQALTSLKAGNYARANLDLEALYLQNKENVWYASVYSENLINLGRWQEAEIVYRKLLDIFPNDFVVSLRLMELLKNTQQYQAALTIARSMENYYPLNKTVYVELAELYQLMKQDVLSMIAEAEYHRLNGNHQRTIKLYDSILETAGIDLATESKIREKRAELVKLRLSQKRKRAVQ